MVAWCLVAGDSRGSSLSAGVERLAFVCVCVDCVQRGGEKI